MIGWLREQLDRDEQTAKAATPGPWRTHDTFLPSGGHTATVLSGTGPDGLRAWLPSWKEDFANGERNVWNDATHIALHDPADVLADVEAKRLILDHYESSVERDRMMRDATGRPSPLAAATGAYKRAVELIAWGYRHRDGYHDEWRTW